MAEEVWMLTTPALCVNMAMSVTLSCFGGKKGIVVGFESVGNIKLYLASRSGNSVFSSTFSAIFRYQISLKVV